MTEELTTGSPAAITASSPTPRAAGGSLARLARLWRGNELALAGATFLALVLLGALLAPLLSPHSPTLPNIRERLQPPGAAYPLGTDELGRDILTRILYGARPILVTGAASVALALVIGTAAGVLAGYRGGRLDNLLMRLMDIVLSFPAILLAILVVAALGAGLVNLVLAIAFSMIPVFARLARSIVLTVVQQDYVLAARALGLPDRVVVRGHVLPNMLAPVLVQATSMLATAFATSAALSFIGLGVEPPAPDWGLMVAEGQRLVFDAPHVPFFPGLVIALTVMSVNFIGDGLRDHLDPTLRSR